MSKKKIITGMLALTMLLTGLSLALEVGGVESSVADILRFDTLSSGMDIDAPREKVKRKVKVPRNSAMQFMKNEDLKDFKPEFGVVNNSMVVDQARRDIENEIKFEDF